MKECDGNFKSCNDENTCDDPRKQQEVIKCKKD